MNKSNIASLVLAVYLATLLVSALALASDQSSSASNQAASSAKSDSSSSRSSSSQATQQRQSPMSTAAAIVGALGSLVPGLITNVAPLFLLVGIGALMMPALGGLGGAMDLFREGRRSSNGDNNILNPQLGNFVLPNGFAHFAARPLQTTPQDLYYMTQRSLPSLMSGPNGKLVMRGLHDFGHRILKAIDNADKRYT